MTTPARALFDAQCAQGSKNSSWWDDAERRRCEALAQAVLLAATPAPSSLAGGEVERIARIVEPDVWDMIDTLGRHGLSLQDAENVERLEFSLSAAREILAALSPEAPAREGEQWGWRVRSKPSKFNHDRPWHWQFDEPTGITAENCEYEPVYTSALTPRHEAPAEGAGERELLPCPFCGGDAEIVHIEDGENEGGSCVCCTVCQASGNLEFERKENFISNWNRRARSSAPEALGNLLAVVHRDGGHRTLEVGVEQAAAEAEKIVANLLSSAPEARAGEAVGVVHGLKADLNTAELPDGTLLYTHPAAPSADKLRIAVEALEPFANLGVTSGPDDEPCHYAYRITRGAIRNARQALDALKADGA